MHELGIVNGLVYINNRFIKTNLYIDNGIITKISKEKHQSIKEYDCHNNLVMPGIIDPHTHLELDLGDKTSLDDFSTGTMSAAYGGVTTIIDFLDPVNNSEDLKKAFNLRKKQAQKSHINYKFHACLKNPKGQVESLTTTAVSLGLNTIKIFTTYSDSNRRTYDHEVQELLSLSKQKDFLLTVHTENDQLIKLSDTYTYHDLLTSRPTVSETSEALKLAKYTKELNGQMYMVHLSSGATLKKLKEEYPDILNKDFIIESCPQYFQFDNNIVKESNGYLYTLAPPLRTTEEKEILKSLIDDVYVIGTDHCPFTEEDKHKTLLKDMPLGIAGIEHSFQIMYSLFGDKIIDKMTSNVAKAHKLFPQKGIIKEGSDADLFIYKKKSTTIKKSHNKQNYTIYKDIPVNGEVISTIIAGKFVLKDQTFINTTGKLLNKEGIK